MKSGALLEIRELSTQFVTKRGVAKVVDGVSFSVECGETLAVVGESGSGKTMMSLSVLRLIPPPGQMTASEIRFNGQELSSLDESEMRSIRGGAIAMIFQEPSTSLNPVFTIGNQIAEAIRLHRDLPEEEIRQEVVEALTKVRVSEPERRAEQYPHELSGGMKQRVMIAMALACRPRLLIADEPTTALDVTIQAHVLEVLRQIQAETKMAILLITHDLGVVAEMADKVVVMYAGKVVERSPVEPLYARPLHPYTRGLLGSVLIGVGQSNQPAPVINGDVPSATRTPSGCCYRDRCPMAVDRCQKEPPLAEIEPNRWSACWFARDLLNLPLEQDMTPHEETDFGRG